MAEAKLTIASKNYGSWSLRGWLLCEIAGLEFDPHARGELRQRHPTIDLAADAVITVADRIVCAAGPMSWVDLLLRLIEMVDGKAMRRLCGDRAGRCLQAGTRRCRMRRSAGRSHAAAEARRRRGHIAVAGVPP